MSNGREITRRGACADPRTGTPTSKVRGKGACGGGNGTRQGRGEKRRVCLRRGRNERDRAVNDTEKAVNAKVKC